MRGRRNISLTVLPAVAALLALAVLMAAPRVGLGQNACAQTLWVAVDEAPLRAAPLPEAELLLRLPRGTELRVLRVQGGWVLVQGAVPGGARPARHEGWLYLSHLAEAPPPPALGSLFDPPPSSMILADVADTARSSRSHPIGQPHKTGQRDESAPSPPSGQSHGDGQLGASDALLATLDLRLTSAALDDFLRQGGIGEYARMRPQSQRGRAQLPPLAPAAPRNTAAEAESERQVGLNLASRVLRRQAKPVFGMALARYVNLVGLAVARHAPGRLAAMRVVVLDLPEPVSFSLPGGLVMLSTGLLAALENEAQLALVLAHEASHAALGHLWAKALAAPFFRQVAVVDAESARGPLFASMLDALESEAQVRGLDPAREFDADAAAIEMAYLAGYDARQFPRAIERIETAGWAQLRQEPPKVWAALHPPTPKRLERIKALLEHLPQQDALALGTERFLSNR